MESLFQLWVARLFWKFLHWKETYCRISFLQMRTIQVWKCWSTGGCRGNILFCLYSSVAYSVWVKLPVVLRKQHLLQTWPFLQRNWRMSQRRKFLLRSEQLPKVLLTVYQLFLSKASELPCTTLTLKQMASTSSSLTLFMPNLAHAESHIFWVKIIVIYCSLCRADRCGVECLWA